MPFTNFLLMIRRYRSAHLQNYGFIVFKGKKKHAKCVRETKVGDYFN